MTRTYALHQLLKHGPLTLDEMVEITGWPAKQVRSIKNNLRYTGRIRKARLFNGWYAL